MLEFIDTNDMTIMTQAEHFMATDVEWDPSGEDYHYSEINFMAKHLEFF